MTVSRRKLEASSWLAVVRAYQECTRLYQKLMQDFNLTIPQFDVLNTITRLGDDATPKAIAAELLVTRGNITGVLYRLEENNLIETHANERDGRSFICELTNEGNDLLKRARKAAAGFISHQLSPFTDAELRQTEAQMREMYAHLREVDLQALQGREFAAAR